MLFSGMMLLFFMLFLHNGKWQLKFEFTLDYFWVTEPGLVYIYFQHGKIKSICEQKLARWY